MRVLNSLIVPKNVKQGPFEIFHLRSNLKDQKNERRTHWRLCRLWRQKSHEVEKGGKSQSDKKSKKGPFCFDMVLYHFLLETLEAF